MKKSVHGGLARAVEQGDAAEAARLLAAGGNPNTFSAAVPRGCGSVFDGDQAPLLSIAAAMGRTDIMELLIDAGADLELQAEAEQWDFFGEDTFTVAKGTPVAHAAGCGRLEALALLFARGARPGTGLVAACEHGRLAAFRAILATGYQPSPGQLAEGMGFACGNGHPRLVYELEALGCPREREIYWSAAVHNAAIAGDLEILKEAVARVGVNHRSMTKATPLIFAAEKGHLELVEYLIGQGAHLNARSSSGRTALSCAVAQGHADVAQLLRDHGAKR